MAEPADVAADNPFEGFAKPVGPANPFEGFAKPVGKLKGTALDAMDIVTQFVASIPKGMAQTADLGEISSLPLAAAKGVRYLLGDKRTQTEKLADVYTPPEARTKQGEYAGTIGELVGGSVLPGLGWVGAARGIAQNAVTAPARSLLGRMVQQAATQTAAHPGRALAMDFASNVTGGTAMQFAKDEGAGPVGQTVAAIGGGMLPAIPSMIAGPVNRVRTALQMQGQNGAYAKFVEKLPDGDINTFANHVATGALGQGPANLKVQRRTLDILGEEMARAGQNRDQAVASALARIQREFNLQPSTAKENLRNLMAVHRDSPLLLSEYTAAAPSNAAIRSTRNIDNLDLRDVARPADSGTQQMVDYLANRPGQSAINVRNAVNERNLGMRDVMREGLEKFGPTVPGTNRRATIADLTQMQDGARRAAKLAYDQAANGIGPGMSGPGMTNERLLVGLLPRILDRHTQRMYGRAGAPAEALRQAVDEFFITRPNGQRLAMMDLPMLQDARGSLRDRIDTARKAGQTQIVATLEPLYRDVTRLMERSNPHWAHANRQWADMRLNDVARELGEAFNTKAGPKYREQVQQFRQLAPEAQDMVKVEFLQKLFDKLDNLGDTHDVAKLFATDHMRNAIRELFGEERAVDLARMTRDAAIATRSARGLQGSQTHMRAQFAREMDAETGVMAAAQDLNIKAVKQAVWEKFVTFWTERRNAPLADIATTPMQDTAEVARHIHNMRVAQEFVRRVQARRPMPATPPIALTGVGSAITSDEAKQ